MVRLWTIWDKQSCKPLKPLSQTGTQVTFCALSWSKDSKSHQPDAGGSTATHCNTTRLNSTGQTSWVESHSFRQDSAFQNFAECVSAKTEGGDVRNTPRLAASNDIRRQTTIQSSCLASTPFAIEVHASIDMRFTASGTFLCAFTQTGRSR